MEEKQFTFYEVYWDAIKDEDNETIDAIVSGICEYMFFGREPSAELGKIAVWDDLFEVLRMERARQEKNPSGRTRRRGMPYFTFKYGYYNKMQCLNYEESGAYVRAICEFMFNGKELQGLPPKVKRYYTVTKLPLELSRKRKIAGAKGGKTNGKNKQQRIIKLKPDLKPQPTAVNEQEPATESERKDDDEMAQEATIKDSDEHFTLGSIEEFGCYGSINSNNSILEGVNYKELYNYVKITPKAHNIHVYKAIEMYRFDHGMAQK